MAVMSRSKVAVLLSTSESTYQKRLPQLLATLIRSGVDPDDIFVVIGGCEAAESVDLHLPLADRLVTMVAQCVPCKNSHCALMWAVADKHETLSTYQWAFLLHDSAEKVPESFGSRLTGVLSEALASTPDLSALKLYDTTGYYNLDAVWAVRDALFADDAAADDVFKLIHDAGGRVDSVRPVEKTSSEPTNELHCTNYNVTDM